MDAAVCIGFSIYSDEPTLLLHHSKGSNMADTFDGPSQATAFNPNPSAEFSVECARELLAPATPALIRTAEVIGVAAGRIVHAGKAVYEKLDSQHRSDMSGIRNSAKELERKGVAFSHNVSEISGNVVNYVRTHNASEMADDLEQVAKRYPVQSLAVAAVAGFLFERMLLKRSCER